LGGIWWISPLWQTNPEKNLPTSIEFDIYQLNVIVVCCFTGFAFECSTPYGINGSFTEERQARKAASAVCSTPYGINGSFTSTLIDRDSGA
jgi:hypothetical protein